MLKVESFHELVEKSWKDTKIEGNFSFRVAKIFKTSKDEIKKMS